VAGAAAGSGARRYGGIRVISRCDWIWMIRRRLLGDMVESG